MLNQAEMEAFAIRWVADWNARDVEAILGTFAEEARFTSPLAAQIGGRATLEGKAALRAYWQAALAETTSLEFRLIDTVCDIARQTLLIRYYAERNGRAVRAAELMRFRDGRQIEGEAFYGAPLV